MMNDDGRYPVVVGPKILDVNYPDCGKIWKEEFDNFSKKIDIIIEHKITGEIIKIGAYVEDIKAHTYNKYPDGQSYNTGDTATFEIESGLIQTGIAYPRSWNAGQKLSFASNNIDASAIEFMGHSTGDFSPSDYKLVKF